MESWENKLDQDLKALPNLEAPPTLIPRVLERLQTPAAAAWYQTPWWQWPSAARLTSVAAVVVVLVVLGWLSGTLGDLGLWRQMTLAWTEFEQAMGVVFDTSQIVLGSGARFWSQYGHTILLGIASAMLATYFTCVAAGTALYQLAWRRS